MHIRGRILGMTAAIVLGLAGGGAVGLVTAAPASADDEPTIQELLDRCGDADYCEFHPQSYSTWSTDNHQVGDTAFNCSASVADHAVNWNDTQGQSNTVGVSVTAGASFFEVLSASVTTTYSHTWEYSHTWGETDTLHLNPGEKGWIEVNEPMQTTVGQYELHFGSRYYGHYYWYVNNYQESGPTDGNPNVSFHSQPMSDQERQQQCGGPDAVALAPAPAPAARPARPAPAARAATVRPGI